MAKKFYGVRAGFQTGVFASWDECQKWVSGFSGAAFKGFMTREEAESYVAGKILEPAHAERNTSAYDKESLHLYVDGSFNVHTSEYGMGYLLIKDNDVVTCGFSKDNKAFCVSSRNVAGEVGAAEMGLLEAYRLFGTQYGIVVHHDYEGVGKWAEGEWKANKPLTQTYKKFINELCDKGLAFSFEHVNGHSGDLGNELADILARHSLGMSVPKEQKLIKALVTSSVATPLPLSTVSKIRSETAKRATSER